MHRLRRTGLVGLLLVGAACPPVTAQPPQPAIAGQAAALRDAALSDDLAWEIVEGLTTEVGQRLAGTEAEARARDWAVARLKELGFSSVRVESFEMPVWARGEERAEIVSPFPQSLAVTALGRSAATPPEGLTADVVPFATLQDLERAPANAVQGRLVYVSHAMRPTQDGSSYGYFGGARFRGPGVAAARGAAGILVRSAGTDHDRRGPHTGLTEWPAGAEAIPAAALAHPDADQLERMLTRGQPVRITLTLTPRWLGTGTSGNVIAEVPGTDPAAGVVLIGGHLDSWDLGTGAIDNAAGVGIVMAAAARVMQAGRPRRTIRVVLFGGEEVGVFGGRAYFERHRNARDVVFVSESDFGADRIWRMTASLPEPARPVVDRLEALLAPLGIVRAPGPAEAGADLGAWVRDGIPAIDLHQDGTRYFDWHHTADDTLDKIDPDQLRQNVAAWVAMLAVVADAPEALGRNP